MSDIIGSYPSGIPCACGDETYVGAEVDPGVWELHCPCGRTHYYDNEELDRATSGFAPEYGADAMEEEVAS